MQYLKDLALEEFTAISTMKSKSVDKGAEAYVNAVAALSAIKVALGVLKVGTRTREIEGETVLTFIQSARVGANQYPWVKTPELLIKSSDGDDTEVPLKELTLMVSSRQTGGKFCCRLLPSCGSQGGEAMGCCWSPIEDGGDRCADCLDSEGGIYLDQKAVYVCHPLYYLKYHLLLPNLEPHVIAELLGAGPVGELPFFPPVYDEDNETESDRVKAETAADATPLKTAVAALHVASGGSNTFAGRPSVGGTSEGFGMDPFDFDAGGLIDAQSALLDDMLPAEELVAFLETASPLHKREMEEIAQVVKVGRAQLAHLHKALKMTHINADEKRRLGQQVTELLASNTQLVGRSMRLYRASLAPTPGLRPHAEEQNEAMLITPAVGSPLAPCLRPYRQSEGEQRVHLAALEAKMVTLNLTLADPNINGLAEVKAVFDEKRRQLDGEIMAARTRLRLDPSSYTPAASAAAAYPRAPSEISELLSSVGMIASRLDRMEVALQAGAGITSRMTNSSMMGDVINRAIVPHVLQPLLQAAVEKVEQAAGSAPMVADTKRKAIFDQMSGGTQLNDLFGRAGAQSVSYSAFTKKSEGMSETTEQTMLMLQVFNDPGKVLDPTTRAKFSRCFPGTAIKFVKMSESPASFSAMINELVAAYAKQATTSTLTGASSYVVEFDTQMLILYSAWMQHLYGSFDLTHGDAASLASAAKAAKVSDIDRLLNPKHQVWSGIQAVFLACINEMWELRTKYNEQHGADLGFVMSMFHIRRYMEDYQKRGWRCSHDSLLASTQVLQSSLLQIGAFGASVTSPEATAAAKKLSELTAAVAKLTTAGSKSTGAADSSKELTALKHQLSQLSDSHQALKKKSTGAAAKVPKTPAQKTREKESAKKWYDKNHPAEAAARDAAAAASAEAKAEDEE